MSKFFDAVAKATIAVTKEFTREKRRAVGRGRNQLTERELASLRDEAKRKERDLIKDAAYKVMESAYMMASDNGRLPANARQIMYAARPLVLEITNGKIWKSSAYFTQTLLPDFQEDHPDLTANWDVVYDARGHLTEPHMKRNLGLGTLEVRSYIASWHDHIPPARVDSVQINLGETTSGPANRFKYALFIEKEGFDALLERSQIAERYDLAIFSSKGMSTTATRMLVDHLAQHDVTILILHDFDLPGLTIAHTLSHDSRRYRFKSEPRVIDLGLRLDDVTVMGLQSEPVEYPQRKDPREKFYEQDYDATDEELNFLVERPSGAYMNRSGGVGHRWTGKRVELNAMTSRQFVDFLEGKLKQHGIEKVVPYRETLTQAWHNAQLRHRINEALKRVVKTIPKEDTPPVPADLEHRLRKYLQKYSTKAWDEALAELVAERSQRNRHLKKKGTLPMV
ncbi:MAG: DUF2399 domain-containing protein [Candidatus Binataceae bacterium]